MKKMTKHPFLWLCCTLLFLPFLVASPSSAQCTMTSAQIDAAVGSCAAGDLNCFVSLAKRNLSCAANIAWYYMIMYAPDNPTAVKNSFLNELPYSFSLENDLRTATSAAYQANRNEQNAGSTTSANEYPYGQ
jgi:hypothetical protein